MVLRTSRSQYLRPTSRDACSSSSHPFSCIYSPPMRVSSGTRLPTVALAHRHLPSMNTSSRRAGSVKPRLPSVALAGAHARTSFRRHTVPTYPVHRLPLPTVVLGVSHPRPPLSLCFSTVYPMLLCCARLRKAGGTVSTCLAPAGWPPLTEPGSLAPP
jgi:hypothetical protein